MAENKTRQPLLVFYQKEIYQMATQALRKRHSLRPHKDRLMHDGAESFHFEEEGTDLPTGLLLMNRDPAYIHNLLVSEDQHLRPSYIVSISSGPKPPSVERDGILVPHHCVRSVGRPELSKRFLLCEDLFFDVKLVGLLRSSVAENDLYSERSALFSTQFEKVEEESLDWLYRKGHLVSYDQVSAELLRVSKVLSLPMAAIHFTGNPDSVKAMARDFCEKMDFSRQL